MLLQNGTTDAWWFRRKTPTLSNMYWQISQKTKARTKKRTGPYKAWHHRQRQQHWQQQPTKPTTVSNQTNEHQQQKQQKQQQLKVTKANKHMPGRANTKANKEKHKQTNKQTNKQAKSKAPHLLSRHKICSGLPVCRKQTKKNKKANKHTIKV